MTLGLARGYGFSPPLKEGIVLSRPNRFVMIVKAGGRVLRCHCPTTGRLGELDVRGVLCLLSKASNPERKTAYTVEAVSVGGRGEGKSWVGINQTAVNRYVEHFLKTGQLSKMASGEVKREVGLGKSRIDFLVGETYLEVKMPLVAMTELSRSLRAGNKAVIAMCYLYEAERFTPPPKNKYNAKILEVAKMSERKGVQTWQLNFGVDKNGVYLTKYYRNRLFA